MKYVNLSIEVLIKDEFGLDEVITISIDNVTLDISYIIFAPNPPLLAGNGGGGGTKYIRGEDYTLAVIGLTVGIIALGTLFGLYQIHFKYPPMVRKIRKLKKTVRKGKISKPILVNKRENIVNKSFKDQRNILEIQKTQPKQVGNVNRITKISKTKDENRK